MALPYPTWRALRPGYLEIRGEALHITVLDLGQLPLPSGRLLVKDAFGFGYGPQRTIGVIPGSASLKATIVEQSGVSLMAYLSLGFQKARDTSFRRITPTFDGEEEASIPEKRQGGFVNRSTYAMVVDETLLKKGLPADDDHCYSMLCHWQNRLDDRPSPWEGHRFDLPGSEGQEALAFFKTRMNEGLTFLWMEEDQEGLPVGIHLDLGMMERLHA